MKRILAGAAFLALCSPAAAQSLKAEIDCRPAGDGPVYDCVITLVDPASGAPVPDASFTVGADMPSMPMAHNIRPVEAVSADRPGTYRARLTLDMHGTWMVKLLVSDPVTTRIDRKVDFFD
jgi:YtkA-like